MRRSSWIILIVALLLVLALVFLQMRPLDQEAPPISTEVAQSILERGKEAVQQHSPNGILALVTPDARLLGQTPDQMRMTLNRAFQEMGNEPVQISWTNLHVQPSGPTGTVTFSLTVGQASSKTEAVYYTSGVTLQLRRVKIEHWFGLFTTEEWRIFQAESDKPLDVGPI